MLIYTLWEKENSVHADGDTPWCIAAIDEYSVEENGFPDSYMAPLGDPRRIVRQLIVEIDNTAVHNLFKIPKTKGKTES